MKNIPTAAQFLNQDQELILDIIDGKLSYSIALDILQNKLIEFTKPYVSAALEEAAFKAKVIMHESCLDHRPYWGVCGNCGNNHLSLDPTDEVDKESILNAYPLENIK
jgi:hypothetical protein